MDYTQRAILGLPIVTDLGEVKPLTIYDFVKLETELHVISFEKSRVLHEYRTSLDEETMKSKDLDKRLMEANKEKTLKEIIIGLVPIFFNAYVAIVAQSMYSDIEDEEEKVLKSYELLTGLDDTQFENLRDIILKVNSQGKQKAFLEYEMQRKKEQGIRLNSQGGEGINLTTMMSSIVAFTGIDYDVISEWNYTRLIHTFNRISMFKNYDTTTLFMTVSGEVQMQNWQENYAVQDDSSTSDTFAVALDDFTKGVGSDL